MHADSETTMFILNFTMYILQCTFQISQIKKFESCLVVKLPLSRETL